MANLGDMDETDNGPGSDDGIFGQGEDVFNHTTGTDSVNPQITRAQEQAPENLPGTPPPEQRRDLVFVQDAMGRVKCAWAVNGNLVEQFRDPTAEEMKLAPAARWRQVQPPPSQPVAMGMRPMGQAMSMGPEQGVTNAPPGVPLPGAQPPAAGAQAQPQRNWFLTALVVGGGLFAAYKTYRWAQEKGWLNPESEEASDEELAEADDVEQVLEV